MADSSPDCQTDGMDSQMVVSEDMTEGMRELQEEHGIMSDEVHVSVTRELAEGGEDIGFSEAQLVQAVSADSGAQMVQAITLADGSTAYIQHPMKGKQGCNATICHNNSNNFVTEGIK